MSTAVCATTVTLTIVRGTNLTRKDGVIANLAHGPSSDPYVKVFVGSKMAGRTSTIYKSLSPEWNEQVLMEYGVADGDNAVRLCIFDEYRDYEDNKMGEILVPLKDVGLGKILHRKFNVQSCEGCEEATGKLEIIMMWESRGETEAVRAAKEKQEAEARKRDKEEMKRRKRAHQYEREEEERLARVRAEEEKERERTRERAEKLATHSQPRHGHHHQKKHEETKEAVEYAQPSHHHRESEKKRLIEAHSVESSRDEESQLSESESESDLETSEPGTTMTSSGEHSCCDDGTGHRGRCRMTAWVLLLVVLPVLYVSLLVVEYRGHGWERFTNRAYPRPHHLVNTTYVDTPHPPGWLLPFTGFASGLITNIVPVQSGLIFAPLFQKHALTSSSEGTLALVSAFQFIGNGLLGGLSWSTYEPKLFACRPIWMVIPCAWLGYLLGVTEPFNVTDNIEAGGLDTHRLQTRLRVALGVIIIGAGLASLFGVCTNGVNRLWPRRAKKSKFCDVFKWILVAFCTVVSGYVFLANIGAGISVTVFILFSFLLDVNTQSALATSCVIGGWASLLPLLVQWFKLGGRPLIRVLMACPCLWAGAILAPWLTKLGGNSCSLYAAVLIFFTTGTLAVSYGVIHLLAYAEDVDVDTEPIFTL